MRIGFAGTPEFALATLDALIAAAAARRDLDIVAVWTQPDRPAGRGRRLTASVVKQRACALGVPVHQPHSLRDPAAQDAVAAAGLDLLVVAAYGQILPQQVLDMPRLGCVNVHASLLPRWRGAAPIQRAILAGDRVTGVGIMQMEAGLDTGPVWRQVVVPIAVDDSGATLHNKLAAAGAHELVQALPAIIAGGPAPTPQDETFKTYATRLSKGEAPLDFSASATVLHDRIRAFCPWPVAQTMFGARQLRIWAARIGTADAADAAPGTVLAAGHVLTVATGGGTLDLLRVQLAGGRPLAAADFVNANACAGVRLGAESAT